MSRKKKAWSSPKNKSIPVPQTRFARLRKAINEAIRSKLFRWSTVGLCFGAGYKAVDLAIKYKTYRVENWERTYKAKQEADKLMSQADRLLCNKPTGRGSFRVTSDATVAFQALNLIREANNAAPNCLDPNATEAAALNVIGYDSAALAAADRIICSPEYQSIRSARANAYIVKSRILSSRHQNEEALEAAREALRLFPDSNSFLYHNALCNLNSGRFKEAKEFYSKIEQDGSVDLDYLIEYAYACHESGDPQGAANKVSRYMSLPERPATQRTRAAAFLFDMGRFEEALAEYDSFKNTKDFNEILARSGADLELYGRLLLTAKRYPDAVEVLKLAVNLNPEHKDALRTLVQAYHRVGDLEKASETGRRLQQAEEVAQASGFTEISGIGWFVKEPERSINSMLDTLHKAPPISKDPDIEQIKIRQREYPQLIMGLKQPGVPGDF